MKSFLLVLNRNENIIPGVARLNIEQAAGYFMLGETQGTSAGGKDEEGKSLRVPGTNPFFPLRHEQQGNRLAELLETHPLEVFLLNTGRVGGPEGDDRSKKVRIPHSSAIVRAIAEGTISWDDDPDFGYQVATEVPASTTPSCSSPAGCTSARAAATSTAATSSGSRPSGPSTWPSSRAWTRPSSRRSLNDSLESWVSSA